MSALTYMQRRKSGTYEFRERLPKALAGKPVPPHMREAFAELVNLATGCFKRELVRSLHTKDLLTGKRRDHREALRVMPLFEAACEAMAAGGPAEFTFTEADLQDIEDEVFASLLGALFSEHTNSPAKSLTNRGIAHRVFRMVFGTLPAPRLPGDGGVPSVVLR
jgi:hypothetical protein